ncbi:HTH domain-containing protein [Acinetobacter bohemicus]|uniref:HTH domain-containing protein n=1 Tax=Acinetobacter bohemicus TaxID=1435036 RepID=UPI00192B2261|nr:HTH domain-containing protein [Acinetobacter bohemicus]CAD9194539.1 hypothetical protein QAC21B_00629 [Acinetobacter bohemicus]
MSKDALNDVRVAEDERVMQKNAQKILAAIKNDPFGLSISQIANNTRLSVKTVRNVIATLDEAQDNGLGIFTIKDASKNQPESVNSEKEKLIDTPTEVKLLTFHIPTQAEVALIIKSIRERCKSIEVENYKVPEGFVLVPVKEIKTWYLDDSENIYREDPDWLCDTPVGEVVEVERRVSYELDQSPVFAAIQWDEENGDVGYYETFESKAEAEKVAAHCKAMIQAQVSAQLSDEVML